MKTAIFMPYLYLENNIFAFKPWLKNEEEYLFSKPIYVQENARK